LKRRRYRIAAGSIGVTMALSTSPTSHQRREIADA
jgi:hypothetical protein